MKRMLIALLLLLAGPKICPAETPDMYGPVTMTAAAETLTIKAGGGQAVALLVTGVTGTAGVQVEASVDGKDWAPLYLHQADGAFVSLTVTANGTYTANASGFRSIRAKMHYITSGLARIILSWGEGCPPVYPLANTTPTP